MADDFSLLFEWLRYPSARVADRHTEFSVTPLEKGVRHDKRLIVEIEGNGAGRSWTTQEAQAFWVDFARLNLWSEPAMLGFVKRRGFAFGKEREFTKDWHGLQNVLRVVGGAWNEPDENGVAVVTKDEARLATANYVTEADAARILESMKVRPDPARQFGKVVLEATSLAAFMFLSARRGLEHRTPVRRCDRCLSWFYMHRKDMLYCSPSCRSMTVQTNRRAKQKALTTR